MDWQIETARDGELTLLLNGFQLYSQYRPIENARKFIRNEWDEDALGYVLFGVGLGYHLKELISLSSGKPVIVFFFNEEEKLIYEQHKISLDELNITWINNLKSLVVPDNYQVIIPYAWAKALGNDHPLIASLHDIKINQMSYRRFAPLMEQNFQRNIELVDRVFTEFFFENDQRVAYLVSSGPSLNETVHWLKKKPAFILCVGSALSVLLESDIIPDAVIITDAQISIKQQITKLYNGPLFYLSTANHEAISKHYGERYIIPQAGYPLAEKFAQEKGYQTLMTGGSVATVALKLLDFWAYEKVVLFGQDFGFKNVQTHADNSTSKVTYTHTEKYKRILANSGQEIFTKPNLLTYLRWFERELDKSSMRVYTTAWDGAKIKGVPYIGYEELN